MEFMKEKKTVSWSMAKVYTMQTYCITLFFSMYLLQLGFK